MLRITVPATEQWDEVRQEFVSVKEQTLQLEHSLVSLSKWESKWCKLFFSKEPKSAEEVTDYVRCMTINKNVDPNVYYCLSEENVDQINKYIEAPMTATTFSNQTKSGSGNGEQISAELIYYWMIALNIPFECDKWHINRLLTLIQVCNVKNSPPKKMSQRQLMSRNAALNAARRKRLNTKG